jgi:hypothetical protein
MYPVVGEQTLRDLVKEYRASGRSYREKVHTVMRGSYSHHDRRMVPKLLSVLPFQSNNDQHQPVIEALDLVKPYAGSRRRFMTMMRVPLDGVVPKVAGPVVGPIRRAAVNRINYNAAPHSALHGSVVEIGSLGHSTPTIRRTISPPMFDQRLAIIRHCSSRSTPRPYRQLPHQMGHALATLDAGMPTTLGSRFYNALRAGFRSPNASACLSPPPWPTSQWRSRSGGP